MFDTAGNCHDSPSQSYAQYSLNNINNEESFSRNSEAFASEFLEALKERFPRY